MADENDTDTAADSQFEAMMAQEAERPDLAPPAPEPEEGDLTPGEMLQATVERGKADAAEKEPATEPKKPAEKVEFTAEEYLRTRDRAAELEKKLEFFEKQGEKKDRETEDKAGLFEDPEGWEAQRKAETKAEMDEIRAEFRREMLSMDLDATRSRIGEEKYNAIDKAVTEAAAADPSFAAQLRTLNPRGAGAAMERWYDKNEPLLNPAAYEARLREKWLAEQAGGATNEPPAGQKPATGANAAGQNVVKLPPSLSRQSAARAASTVDDGDDSEAAIFAAGANPRRA